MIKLVLVLALKLYLYLVHWSPHTVCVETICNAKL